MLTPDFINLISASDDLITDKIRSSLWAWATSNRRGYHTMLAHKKELVKLNEMIMSYYGATRQEKLFNFTHNTVNPKCEHCNENDVHLVNGSAFNGWDHFCSNSCSGSSEMKRLNYMKTCKERYGMHVAKTPEYREKYKKTWHNNEDKNRLAIEKSKLTRRGTCLERYGATNAWGNSEIQAKAQKSANTSMHKYKLWLSPSGKEYLVRGYEHLAINLLIQSGISENDIEANDFNTPQIKWNDGIKDFERTYHPDIYIKPINTLIEVKSTYWFMKQPDKCKRTLAAALSSGFNMEIWVFNGKNEIVSKIVSVDQIDTVLLLIKEKSNAKRI